LNIAHITNYSSSRYGGVLTASNRMMAALSRLGIGISLWSLSSPDGKNDAARGGITTHLFETAWPKSWWRSPELARALESHAEQHDIFHIHEVWSYPQYISARTARRRDIPYIVTPHASLEPWRVAQKGLKKSAYLKLVGNTLLNHAACLHAVATAEVEGFRKIGYRGPAFIVHNGIVPEEFACLPDPGEAERKWPGLVGKRVVLFLSRLSPEKGLDELIAAWSTVVEKPSYSDALLVLAGPDDRGYSVKVHEMVHSAGVTGNVLLPGMVEGRQKMSLMARAGLYTLPSYSEGFSISLLENLAAGKPVLITPGCNFPDVEKVGAGLCVEPRRGDLAKALMRLLDTSPETLREMGSRGKCLITEHYTWDIAARKIAAVYRAILRNEEIPLHPEPVPVDGQGRAIL